MQTDSQLLTGIVIVDHGSRRAQSNQLLERVAELFAERFRLKHPIVEPAHMELCEPSIGSAFARCVGRGAKRVVVCPFFLGPGKHWTTDIPRLTAEAAHDHPGTAYHVAPPLGIDDLILDLLDKRIGHCQEHGFSCDLCRGTLRSGEPGIEIPVDDDKASTNGQCSTCPFVVQPDGKIVDRRTVMTVPSPQ